MVLLLAMAAAVPLQSHFDATEFANAVYHTACMTGRLNCSRDVYQRFWNEKYHATPDDGARFDEFGRILDELESTVKPGQPMPLLPNDFSYFPAVQVREHVVATAFGSRSAADFLKRAVAFATPSQAARLAGVLAHFQQRLHPWWVATGRRILAGRSGAIERRLRDLGVPGMAAEVAAFLEARPDARGYYLHAVPSPEYEGTAATATLVSNHFCVEITHEFVLDDFAWVTAHELTHSLYRQAPQAQKDALMRQFVESRDPSAQPFYMYLNEAMATAVGLLIVERNGKTLKDPYREVYIPRLAEAALPLLRSALANRKTLYDGFTLPYLAAARRALGEEADGLQFRFSCVALLGDDEVRSAFLQRLPLRYFVTGQQDWERYARMDGILMLRYAQIHFDGDDRAEMGALMGKHRGFVYIARKEQHLDVFMLGRDNAALKELGNIWAGSKERVREGLIFAID
jgi:hypothetical protein